jgi:hypothetical protein
MLGYCSVADLPIEKIMFWSEINFKPFGYFLTYDSPPPNRLMVDITSFKDFEYGQSVKVNIRTFYLKVSTPVIGSYDHIPELDNEER